MFSKHASKSPPEPPSDDEVSEDEPVVKPVAKAKSKPKPPEKIAAMKKQTSSLGKARTLAGVNARDDAAKKKSSAVKPEKVETPEKVEKVDNTEKLTMAEIAVQAEMVSHKERSAELSIENEKLRCQVAAAGIIAKNNGISSSKWNAEIKEVLERLGHKVHSPKKRKISGSQADADLSDSSDEEESKVKKTKKKMTI